VGRLAPDLPVLYCSGYTGDEVARRGLVAEGADFLSKPFTPADLLGRIRSMLDRAPRPA
jgi:DNA-binding response OmpR family regulator